MIHLYVIINNLNNLYNVKIPLIRLCKSRQINKIGDKKAYIVHFHIILLIFVTLFILASDMYYLTL